jgi:hypothetical protein
MFMLNDGKENKCPPDVKDPNVDQKYILLVEEAIRRDLDLDISNSTFSHAAFLTEELLKVAKREINILSGSLNEALYGEKMKGAFSVLSRNIDVKIIIWHTAKQSQIDNLKALNNKIQIKLASREEKPENYERTKHFMVVDEKAFRLEEPHSPQVESVEDFQVKGVANFNKPEVAKALRGIFCSLWDHPSLITV